LWQAFVHGVSSEAVTMKTWIGYGMAISHPQLG